MEGDEMTPEQIKALRARLGLSAKALGDTLQIESDGGRYVRFLESGERPVRGPVRIVLEMLERGELPARYLVTPAKRGRKPKVAEQ